jgi:hypothetical protein
MAWANQAVGLDAGGESEPSNQPQAPPVQLVPLVPVVKVKLLEETSRPTGPPPPGATRRAKKEASPTFPMLEHADDGSSHDIQKKLQRRQTRDLMTEVTKELDRRERLHKRWRLEANWFDCLLFPFVLWKLVLGLAFAWATQLSFMDVMLMDIWESADLFPRLATLWFLGLVGFLLFGYTCRCHYGTYASASFGQGVSVSLPTKDLAPLVRFGAQALWCFLLGPIVPVTIAYFFWLNCGDPELIDRLILWELLMAALVYWIMAALAVHQSNRFRDANPLAVWALIKRRGWRLPVTAASIAIAVIGTGPSAIDSVVALHRGPGGWFGLFFCLAILFSMLLFLCRWLGISVYYARKARNSPK